MRRVKRWIYVYKYANDIEINLARGWKVQGAFKFGGRDNICLRRPETLGLTPIQQIDRMWFKRDDLFEVAGVRGGKVRTCLALAEGATGLVSAGSRKSPQCAIVGAIAAHLKVPCRLHTPRGQLSSPLLFAQKHNAEVIQHSAGYNNVIIARAREDARERKWRYIPFGMECAEAVYQTARQAENIPAAARRIVVPVGSGMSLAGVLSGLSEYGFDIPVLGVAVGADPVGRLDLYAPPRWRQMVQIVKSPLDYHKEYPQPSYYGIDLDPIYEAKTIPFLRDNDLLWIVGIRPGEV